jgi:hypothetical protein
MKNSTHVDVVTLTDGRRVCLSYGVIVAAFIPKGSGPYDEGHAALSHTHHVIPAHGRAV